MAYCRWSSDNFTCDVYVYEDATGGWTIHVASRRRTEPSPSWDDLEARNEWSKRGDDPALWIELPKSHAGQSYNFGTIEEAIDKLIEIRQAGFNVPESALAALKEELDGD